MSARKLQTGLLGVLLFLLASAAPGQAPPAPGGDAPNLPPPRKLDGGAGGARPNPVLPLVDFRGVTLDEAMRLLSQQSGLKIQPSADAGKTIISSYLRDVPALDAVNTITQTHKLITRGDDGSGIIRIYTVAESQLDPTSLREEQTKVFTLLYPNAVDAAQAIQNLFGDRVQLSFGEQTDDLVFQNLTNALDRFDIIDTRTLGIGIGGFGQGGFGGGQGGFGGGLGGFGGGVGGFGGGQGGFGGGQGGFGGGGRGGFGGFGGGGRGGFGGRFSDSIRDDRFVRREVEQAQQGGQPNRLTGFTTEEVQAIEDAALGREGSDRTRILELLRRRPATIYVSVIQRNNQVVVRTGDPQTMQHICELIAELDVPTPMVLLEVKVLSIDLRDDFQSMFDYQFTDGILAAGSFTSGNILPPFADALEPAARRFATLAPGPLGTTPTDNFLFQIVSNNFRFRMQLLETKNRVTELASPLLLIANSEASRIFIGQSIPITVGFTPSTVIANGNAAATTVVGTPITTLVDVGTSLFITPNINCDRTVTLRLLQERSRVIENGGQIPVVNSAGIVTQVNVDTVARQQVSGTFVAKDGLAIAIGGLIEEGLNDNREEVPVIGKLPIAGFFFRRQTSTRFRRELVVLIRPFVISTSLEGQSLSKQLLESVSIHPNTVNADFSNIGAYTPQEVLRPRPPENKWQNIFRVHTFLPKDF
ncbi:MAG: hypothetical protein JNM56_19900 [Planctomycetia bacterium]|nr:hypothetical protein [Planctomycetia bacterium]